MTGLLRLVVLVMMLSLVGSLAAPSASARLAQETDSQPVGMVSGPWRMMAWQFAFAPEFTDQGLDAREGHNWGILIADMTNTGVDGGLSVADVKLGGGEVGGDPAESVRVSRALGFETIGDDGVLPIAENGIARVAVVMDIPQGVGYPAISIGDESVSLESVMTETLDLAGLPEAQTAMQLEVGSVLAIFSSSEYELALDSGEFRQITLEGLTPPVESSCHSESSKMFVTELPKEVWIESLPGVDSPTLWQHDAANGVFVLLDQRLVEAGLVEVISSNSEDASVYTEWLAPKANEAEASNLGMFGDCPEAAAVPTPTLPSNEGTGAYDSSIMVDVVSNPYAYVGTDILLTGFAVFPEVQNGNTFFILANEIDGQEVTFIVGYPGIHQIPEAALVNVTGLVGEPVENPLGTGFAPTVTAYFVLVVEAP